MLFIGKKKRYAHLQQGLKPGSLILTVLSSETCPTGILSSPIRQNRKPDKFGHHPEKKAAGKKEGEEMVRKKQLGLKLTNGFFFLQAESYRQPRSKQKRTRPQDGRQPMTSHKAAHFHRWRHRLPHNFLKWGSIILKVGRSTLQSWGKRARFGNQ